MVATVNYDVILPSYERHPKQKIFIDSNVKRIIIRAGRRGGKTEGVAIRSIKRFLMGRRQLYAAPTTEQLGRWWFIVTSALAEPIAAGYLRKNETEHFVEVPGTEQRIKGKTAWNANTLRGDFADDLILDEWQLMDEDAWGIVGAPMLLDNDGDAVFIYTPPSLHSRGASKARDPQHAAKQFKLYEERAKDEPDRYLALTFSSHENPYISSKALDDISKDMTALAIRQEIEAEDIDEAPGALWHRRAVEVAGRTILGIEDNRVIKAPKLVRIVVGVDPSGSATGDACGIVACGIDYKRHHYTLEDNSVQGSPDTWAQEACKTYHKLKADIMVAEKNYGGEMVEKVIRDTDATVNIKLVSATRGKAVRAEPISAKTERGEDHMVGKFPELEDELCLWLPGDKSPNRLDAKVWADTELNQLTIHIPEQPEQPAKFKRDTSAGWARKY